MPQALSWRWVLVVASASLPAAVPATADADCGYDGQCAQLAAPAGEHLLLQARPAHLLAVTRVLDREVHEDPEFVGAAVCHTATSGEECYKHVTWAMAYGFSLYPVWYPGLSNSSSFEDFQNLLHTRGHGNCSLACADEPADTSVKVIDECHDASVGDSCYSSVTWALNENFKAHPDWYDGLTSTSTFQDFQLYMHEKTQVGCPRPCAAGETSVPTGTALPGGSCRAVKQWDPCNVHVTWAMTVGIRDHPDWYPGLTASSSFVEFQQLLHINGHGGCPMPCPGDTSAPPGPDNATEGCHTARPGDWCYVEVTWAMLVGIHSFPEWYPGMSASDSRDDFQKHLFACHHVQCPQPCDPPTTSTTSTTTTSTTITTTTSTTQTTTRKRKVTSTTGTTSTTTAGLPSFDTLAWGTNKSCRGLNSSDNRASDYVLHLKVQTLDDCKALCLSAPVCTGIEYWDRFGRCEVHTVPILATAISRGFVCLRYIWHPAASLVHSETVLLQMNAPKFGTIEPAALPAVLEEINDISHVDDASCHTTTEGEECFEHVLQAMQDIASARPSGYTGLSLESSFEDFQDFLHVRRHANCPKACRDLATVDRAKVTETATGARIAVA